MVKKKKKITHTSAHKTVQVTSNIVTSPGPQPLLNITRYCLETFHQYLEPPDLKSRALLIQWPRRFQFQGFALCMSFPSLCKDRTIPCPLPEAGPMLLGDYWGFPTLCLSLWRSDPQELLCWGSSFVPGHFQLYRIETFPIDSLSPLSLLPWTSLREDSSVKAEDSFLFLHKQ